MTRLRRPRLKNFKSEQNNRSQVFNLDDVIKENLYLNFHFQANEGFEIQVFIPRIGSDPSIVQNHFFCGNGFHKNCFSFSKSNEIHNRLLRRLSYSRKSRNYQLKDWYINKRISGREIFKKQLCLSAFIHQFVIKSNFTLYDSSKDFLKFVEKYKTERWLTRSLEEKELLSKGI